VWVGQCAAGESTLLTACLGEKAGQDCVSRRSKWKNSTAELFTGGQRFCVFPFSGLGREEKAGCNATTAAHAMQPGAVAVLMDI